MGSSFFERYKDVRWQKKRLETLEHYGWCCQVCSESAQQLQVHHKRYLKNADPWEYSVDQLSVVCESCHEYLTESSVLLNEVLSYVPVFDPIGAADLPYLIAGLYTIDIPIETDQQRIMYETGNKIEWLFFDLLKKKKA